MKKNILITFTVQTFVQAETDQEFQDKKYEIFDDLEAKGIAVITTPIECGRDQLE